MDTRDDPGWRPSARYALLALVPGYKVFRTRKGPEGDGLVALRNVFLTFLVALVLIGVVVLILDLTSSIGTLPEVPVLLAVLGAGSVSIGASLLGRRLDCHDQQRLAKSYVQRFFLRVALAESAALLGFVAFVLTGAGWMYLVGACFSAIGFGRLAPTAAHLRRDQEELRAMGCEHALIPALRQHSARR